MATVDERIKILKMIQDGKISAEQGVQLLEALDAGAKRAAPRPPAPPAGIQRETSPAVRGGARWFRVQVTDTTTGRTRVNVRLPVGMVNAGIKMGARFAPQVEGLDPEELMRILNSGETGKIVDVYDDDDGEHVEVFIE
jgi:hypothetical protein